MPLTVVASLLWLTVLAGCGTYPVSEGSHKALPRLNSRAVVWGGDVSAAEEAGTWLKHRGLTIAEEIFRDEPGGVTHTPRDEAQLRELAKRIEAETVVFVDVSIRSRETWTFGVSGTMQEATVAVRGISAETGEVMFQGVAKHFRPYTDETGVTPLTCYALASAWNEPRSSCEPRNK
jgi:hypothetical protein